MSIEIKLQATDWGLLKVGGFCDIILMAFLFLLANSSGYKDTLDLQCRGLSQPDFL